MDVLDVGFCLLRQQTHGAFDAIESESYHILRGVKVSLPLGQDSLIQLKPNIVVMFDETVLAYSEYIHFECFTLRQITHTLNIFNYTSFYLNHLK